ncbi:hypothetical protein CHS0354_024143 [Potamilus streckersoni]|uniref:HhH-GPD domain-containing protein n=1 Tax=Potamilus streckersoni TaxID=2493646 RepID=A0AAE0S011_9BIVA|nr:hypothetical protein CHS0354_024143 [Potamilus streckersoni]
MDKRVKIIADVFGKAYPSPKSELVADSPFQMLIATMLAAQCTDKRVNIVTKVFFRDYPSVQLMGTLSVEEVKGYISSINFFNNKAKNIVGICSELLNKFGGVVPETLEELVMLPGIGRKTAHVVMSQCFGKPVMAVDTHVFRVSRRIGLSKGRTPLAVEKELIEVVPTSLVKEFHHYLILHGRYVCKARVPMCDLCKISHLCEFNQNGIGGTKPRAGFMGLGGQELLVILIIVLLLFGAKKLPELARGLGRSISEFRNAQQDVKDEFEAAMRAERKQKSERNDVSGDQNETNTNKK